MNEELRLAAKEQAKLLVKQSEEEELKEAAKEQAALLLKASNVQYADRESLSVPPISSSSEKQIERELSDFIYIYCPSQQDILMLYSKMPTGAESALLATPPPGELWYSDYSFVQWSDVNGGRYDKFPVKEDCAIITYSTRALVKLEGIDEPSEIDVHTIIVRDERYEELLKQLSSHERKSPNGGYILDLKTKLYHIKDIDFNENKVTPEILEDFKEESNNYTSLLDNNNEFKDDNNVKVL